MKLGHKLNQPHVRSWTLLLVFIALFLIIGLIIGTNKPKPYPDYVTDSPAPTGIKAFYTYLHHHDQDVGIWTKEAQALPTNNNQLMVMIEPYKPFDQAHVSYWKDWMSKGNSLLLVVDDPKGFFNLPTQLLPNYQPSTKPITINGSDYLKGTFKGIIQTDVRLKPSSGDHPLLKDKAGVIALSHDYGKGHLMVVLAPNWVTNDQILKNDHLKLILSMLNQIKPQTIWLNEHIHGYKSLPTFLTVYPKWFLFFFGDLLLFLLLWLWYKGKRFGPVEIPREWVVRFGDERLHASAAWYRRGRFYSEALRSQITYLRSRIQEKWGISMHVDYKEMLAVSERRLTKEQFKAWQENWQEIQAIMEEERLKSKAFLILTNRINEMRKEVEDHDNH